MAKGGESRERVWREGIPLSPSAISKTPKEVLKYAYLSFIELRMNTSAARYCTNLITFDRCKISFSEYSTTAPTSSPSTGARSPSASTVLLLGEGDLAAVEGDEVGAVGRSTSKHTDPP